MRVMNATEVRKQWFQIIREGEEVEITHPERTMALIPKEELDEKNRLINELEKQLLVKEMDEALAKPHKWYTTEQVEAMLAEVLSKKEKTLGKMD
ncbi:hypothetical protein WDW89_18780 [Deltaproteobacteria bacterium TL4]